MERQELSELTASQNGKAHSLCLLINRPVYGGQAFYAVFMREFVSLLIPRRRACDTIADAASAQGRFHPAASQTPRDLVQFCLACRPPSASEIVLSRAFLRTPTDRSYPRKESSTDCAARSKRERGGRSRDRTTVDRATEHTGHLTLCA